MKISERAMNFIFRVYKDNITDVIHALLVGILLKSYGYDENVVAAGYLHDIPIKSDYTIDDISRLFGGQVASLVMTALNVDKSLDLRETKLQTVKNIKNLPERNMAVIVADYIIDIEEESFDFDGNNKNTISKVLEPEELKDFYKIVYNEAKRVLDPSFVTRFYDAISNEGILDKSIKYNEYDNSLLNSNKKYQAQLIKLKEVISDNRPYIIEFVGSEKSGKSTIMSTFKDFFDAADFRIKVFDKKEQGRFTDTYVRPNSVSLVERNLLISSAIKDNLMKEIIGDQSVVMVESGLYDALIMLKIYFDRGILSKEQYNNYMNKYSADVEFLVNHVVVCYANQEEIMSRMSFDNLDRSNFYAKMAEFDEYNEALNNLDVLINNRTVLDTSKLDSDEATLRLADTLFPIMKDNYVLKLKKIIDDRM